MREEIIDIKDLSDSREVMMKKTPPSISAFLVIITLLLVVSFTWAYFSEIDMYVTASGEIRPTYSSSTVTSSSGGKITTLNYNDGDFVRKGDVLLKIDCDIYLSQKDKAKQQADDKKIEIENYLELIKAIECDVNTFDENDNAKFYFQYKSYEADINNVVSQHELSEIQFKNTLNEIELVLSQTEKNLKNAKTSIDEYKEFYDTIKNDDEYIGENQYLKDIYSNYRNSLDKAKAVYEGYLLQYNVLQEQYQTNMQMITKEQVEQALHVKNSSYSDMQSVKSSLLIQINESISVLKQDALSHEATIENYLAKKDTLEQKNDLISKKQQIKDSYYLNINNSIASLKLELDSIEEQISNINTSIDSGEIKAEADGILMYNQEFAIGDTLVAGTVIGTVLPHTEEYETIIYIPECYIAEMVVGQKVEYIFSSISYVEFGKVYGKITYISKDSFLEQTTGQKFYKASASLENISLNNDKGETRKIQSGMVVEIRAITGERTVLNWLLDKLNFS